MTTLKNYSIIGEYGFMVLMIFIVGIYLMNWITFNSFIIALYVGAFFGLFSIFYLKF